MEEKIKVLQSVISLGIGGNEMFVMNFFRNIDKEKFQIDFLIYDDKKTVFYKEVVESGSKVYIINNRYNNKILNFISQICQVRKVLKETDYNIIHCHSCSFIGIFRAAIPGFLNRNIKVISHSHNPGMPKNNKLDNIIRNISKWILSHIVDMGFSCSDLAGESKYTSKFINSDKYKIIHNAINVKKYCYNEKDRIEIRQKCLIEDKVIIGNVGRLSYQKNQGFLLELFKSLLKKKNNVVLMIIGGGELEDELKNKADELQIKDNVIFTGSINDVSKYYSAMDVFVMPSIYEGLPFTAIEAQVNGLKCVISDKVTKMVDVTGDTKFISLSESYDTWVDAIIESSEERSDSEKVANVVKDYDLKKETIRLEQLYSLIIG